MVSKKLLYSYPKIEQLRLTHFNSYNLRGFRTKQILYFTLILSFSLFSCSHCQFVIITPPADDIILVEPYILQWWCPFCLTVKVHFFIYCEADLFSTLNGKLLNSWRVAYIVQSGTGKIIPCTIANRIQL